MKKQLTRRVAELHLRVAQCRIVQYGRRLVGLEDDEFDAVFGAALLPESVPVVEEILDQIDQASREPPRHTHDGTPAVDTPGFVLWLRGLREGWFTLPEPVPHAVIQAYRDWQAPLPIWRCDDCGMGLPHNTIEYQFRPCPVCGSARLFLADLSRPLGQAWIDSTARSAGRAVKTA